VWISYPEKATPEQKDEKDCHAAWFYQLGINTLVLVIILASSVITLGV
jgi:hypothetical protein